VKTCRDCRISKPLDEFYSSKGGRDGRRPECKACNLATRQAKYRENPGPYIERTRKWQRENPDRVRANMERFKAAGKRTVSNRKSHLKRKYGLTLQEFDALLASQGGGCAICGRPDADNVDHDHTTGRVRGILCFNCNVAIGQLEDDEDRLAAAMTYVTRNDELSDVARARAVALAR
jgi:hypothetical protein